MQQDYAVQIVRDAAILTNGYVEGTILSFQNTNPALRNQLNILLAFTIGSLTDAQIKVEYSTDGTTYFQETFLDIATTIATASLGVYKLTGTGNFILSIPIKAAYIKISAIGTGTVTSSSLAITAIVGTA